MGLFQRIQGSFHGAGVSIGWRQYPVLVQHSCLVQKARFHVCVNISTYIYVYIYICIHTHTQSRWFHGIVVSTAA